MTTIDPIAEGFTEIPADHFAEVVAMVFAVARPVQGGTVYTVTSPHGQVLLVGFKDTIGRCFAQTAK